jgi:hypothetical protein
MPTWEYRKPSEREDEAKANERRKRDVLPRTEADLDDKINQIYRQMVSIDMPMEDWYRMYGWIECLRWMLNRGDLTDGRSKDYETIRAKRSLPGGMALPP